LLKFKHHLITQINPFFPPPVFIIFTVLKRQIEKKILDLLIYYGPILPTKIKTEYGEVYKTQK